MENPKRVHIWNSFFGLAWDAAKRAHEHSTGKTCHDEFQPLGGTLPRDQHDALATLALCNLAIEARANHLIEELVENGTVTEAVGRAARWLPTKEKWFLLPTLAGKASSLRDDAMPHQAVASICELRNHLVHVNFDRLKDLPKPNTLQSYFRNFVEAMEDMNVILGRTDSSSKRPDVLRLGEFRECR